MLRRSLLVWSFVVLAAVVTLRPMLQESPKWSGQSPWTILVLGIDDVRGTHRADTIMLVVGHLSPPSVSLISIPRDLRVWLPGHGWDKINAAYLYGDLGLTRQTIQDLLDVRIDRSVVVNYAGFKHIVDRLGGIDYTVEQPMYYEDRAQDLRVDLQPGPQHFDG